MNAIQIIGELVSAKEVASNSGYKSKEVVLRTDAKFNNLIPIKVNDRKVAEYNKLANIPNGTIVTVSVWLGGREWNGKYFVTVDLDKVINMTAEPADASGDFDSIPNDNADPFGASSDDEMPF